MKRNNKGFTLIELLAVIVVLSIILTIATTAVLKTIKESKEKAKYIAAKEIVEIAEAYMETETEGVIKNCVNVKVLVEQGYLEADVTNPNTGENISKLDDLEKQQVCKGEVTAQDDYEVHENKYNFDGYIYKLQ